MGLTVTTIDLLRHGACEGGEIFRGSSDVPLTPAGWQQMTAALAPHAGWQRVICSSLRRCCDFASQYAEGLQLPWQIEPALREISFGDWEGQLVADIEREQGDRLRRFWHDPEAAPPPNGEPMAIFGERVLGAMDALIDRYRGEHLLLVTHGAVVRRLMCHWLQMPLTAFTTIAVPYGSFTRFRLFESEAMAAGERAAPWVQLCLHVGETG